MASVALLDLSILAELGMPAHKNGFSRAGYSFHSRANSPFQQRSYSKKEIRVEIFHANQGEKEPQLTSCYESRVWYILVLLLTTIHSRDAQGAGLSLPSSTNSYSHKILTAVHRGIARKWPEWKMEFFTDTSHTTLSSPLVCTIPSDLWWQLELLKGLY